MSISRYLVSQHVRLTQPERRKVVINPGSRRVFVGLGQSHLSQKIPAATTRCVYLDHLLSVPSTGGKCTIGLAV